MKVLNSPQGGSARDLRFAYVGGAKSAAKATVDGK